MPRRTVETPVSREALVAMGREVDSVLTTLEVEVLGHAAAGESLRQIAARRQLTRARIHQVQTAARVSLASVAPALVASWRTVLAAGPVPESVLFGTGTDDLRDAAVAVLWAVVGARLVRAEGEVIPGFWMRQDDNIPGRMWLLASGAPVDDRDFDDAARAVGIDPTLCRLLLDRPGQPLLHDDGVRGWVRRRAPLRDGAALLLSRWQRPASSDEVAAALAQPRAVVAGQLVRDPRFRRLVGQRAWALASWGDLGEGTRYRGTRDAIRAVLDRGTPLAADVLIPQVRALHPVSATAVRHWLQHEEFGRFPDGRYGFSESGAAPHQDTEPLRHRDVVEVTPDRIVFALTVDPRVLSGGSVPVPDFVGWWLGVRRPPQHRVLSRPAGPPVTVTRRPGYTSMSSLRADTVRLGVRGGCRLRIAFDRTAGLIEVTAACPCHRSRNPSRVVARTASG